MEVGVQMEHQGARRTAKQSLESLEDPAWSRAALGLVRLELQRYVADEQRDQRLVERDWQRPWRVASHHYPSTPLDGGQVDQVPSAEDPSSQPENPAGDLDELRRSAVVDAYHHCSPVVDPWGSLRPLVIEEKALCWQQLQLHRNERLPDDLVSGDQEVWLRRNLILLLHSALHSHCHRQGAGPL